MADATDVVEHEVRVAATPEVVFQYFTDPRKVVAWMGEEATVDPRPDGICRIVINGTPMLGRFTRVERPSRLAFTWGFEQRQLDVPPQSTCVEVSLTGDGDGTLVRVSHRRLPPAAASFHRAGWRHYLDRLETTLRAGAPGPDPWASPATVARAIAEAGDA